MGSGTSPVFWFPSLCSKYGHAGPFSVERLKTGLPFVNVFVCATKYTAKRRPSDLYLESRLGLSCSVCFVFGRCAAGK